MRVSMRPSWFQEVPSSRLSEKEDSSEILAGPGMHQPDRDHLSGVSRLPEPVAQKAVVPSTVQATMELAKPEPNPPVGDFRGLSHSGHDVHGASGLAVNHTVAAAVAASARTPPAINFPDLVVPV